MYIDHQHPPLPAFDNHTSDKHWHAHLQLSFERREQKTILSQRKHTGPLTIQRPFYPEGGLCHVYLLHPPGGVVASDRLHINIHAQPAAQALITTPAAAKFYRSAGATAEQCVNIQVDNHATVEWLPQETILFEGSKLHSSINVSLHDSCAFIGWEILVFGRPACGEAFNKGEATLDWRVIQNNRPLLLEHMLLDKQAFHARWGLNGQPVCATMLALSANQQALEAVRSIIGDTPGQGVTLIDDLLICRALNDKTEPVRRFFETVRQTIRPALLQRDNCTPRIWAT